MLVRGPLVLSQESTNEFPRVEFSATAPIQKLDAPPPATVMQKTLGRWDDQIVEHHYDHLENVYGPDRLV